ncbi:MAG: hypothetical protein CL832_10455 [Crocinitomicaceae bacterium]|jgi:hypothetical protein|nr:hypothetical protein [Crocinitomicaceae bacterium]
MANKFEVDMNISITVQMSEDYLKDLGMTPEDWPIDHMANDDLSSKLLRSVVNQCFRNNKRQVNALVVTDITEPQIWKE